MTNQAISFRGTDISGDCTAMTGGHKVTIIPPGIGGLGTPDVLVTAEQSRYGSHGVVAASDYFTQRLITIPLMIHKRNDGESAMKALRALKGIWKPALYDEMLQVTVDGIGPSDDTLRFFGRPRSTMDADLSQLYTGTIWVMMTFQAMDPIGYGPEQTVALGASTTVTNPGDMPTDRATISVVGNGGTPTITNTSLGGQKIQFKQAVPSGQTWQIDLRRQTVTNATGEDKFETISPTSTWFDLRSGTNVITLTGASSASITFRGGWA